MIVASLERVNGEITETIKIVTHSMGGAYGKGYVAGLKKYLRDYGISDVLISLVVDFDPFQTASMVAGPEIYTEQYSNIGGKENDDKHWTGGLANQIQKGADKVLVNEGEATHFLGGFFKNISKLKEGTYKWNESDEKWECTNCKE